MSRCIFKVNVKKDYKTKRWICDEQELPFSQKRSVVVIDIYYILYAFSKGSCKASRKSILEHLLSPSIHINLYFKA